MPTEKKVKVVSELEEMFSSCNVGIFTDYRGLTTAELTALRRKMQDAGVTYHVVKNSLAQRAAENAGRKELTAYFQGPVAVACGFDDVTKPAKLLAEHIKASKSILAIKGGFLRSRILSPQDVESLATIPGKEVLIGKLMAGMQSPIYRLVNSLASPMRGLAQVLQARINQLEGE